MNREVRDLVYSVLPSEYLQFRNIGSALVLSAPHGGGMKPFSFPRRKYGTLGMDTYTRRITSGLVKASNIPLSYIISDIHRSKVDFNRDIDEGAQGNKKAEELWNLWNTTLGELCKSAVQTNGKALYIDIHSHNDSNKFELGYNLGAKDYVKLMNTGRTRASTTLDSLGKDKWGMLFGEYSIKSSLEAFGYKTLIPTGKDVYFNGGRNIETFSGKGVGAIQIEVPVSIAKIEMPKLLYVLRFSIARFMKEFVYDD